MSYIARSPIKYRDEKGGERRIEPGRRVPDELVDDGLIACGAIEDVAEFAKGLGFEGDDAPVKPLARMNRAELDAIVSAEGVDLGDAATNAQIVSAIEAARIARTAG